MNKMPNTHYFIAVIISMCYTAQADELLSIRPKISGYASTLQMNYEHPQALPSLNVNQGITEFINTDIQLNQALLTPAVNITKDNEELLSALQFSFGIELGLNLSKETWPSKTFIFNPVSNLYVITEESSHYHINGGLYRVLPKMSWGGDVGCKISNNGNHIQLGAGALSYSSEYETGIIYRAFTKIDNTAVDPLDVTSMIADDLKPYTANQKTLFPYVYTEISTEIGDLISLFFKANYSFEQSPSLSNLPIAGTQMFPDGSEKFETNNKWRFSSISIGISSELGNMGLF